MHDAHKGSIPARPGAALPLAADTLGKSARAATLSAFEPHSGH
jgi:hypothetical protein